MSGVHITVVNFWNLERRDFWNIAQKLFDRLVIGTPYDTGNCLDNWEIDYIDVNSVEIWNDTEYISYLEDGHSKQKPNGWIEDTLNKYREIMYDYINS